MATEKEIINGIISREGGYVNHPADRGGATNYGINHITLSAYLGHSVTTEEIRNLDVELAKEIYLTEYFYTPRIHSLPAELRNQVFDMVVNHGARQGIRLVQQVINKSGFGPINEDGVIGPQTRAAIVKAYDLMGDYLINAIADERIAYYEAIAARNSSQTVFLKGWLARAKSFKVKTTKK